MSKKAIILGGGFAGCTAANFLKKKGDGKIYFLSVMSNKTKKPKT